MAESGFTDETIVCRDCSQEFIHTVAECVTAPRARRTLPILPFAKARRGHHPHSPSPSPSRTPPPLPPPLQPGVLPLQGLGEQAHPLRGLPQAQEAAAGAARRRPRRLPAGRLWRPGRLWRRRLWQPPGRRRPGRPLVLQLRQGAWLRDLLFLRIPRLERLWRHTPPPPPLPRRRATCPATARRRARPAAPARAAATASSADSLGTRVCELGFWRERLWGMWGGPRLRCRGARDSPPPSPPSSTPPPHLPSLRTTSHQLPSPPQSLSPPFPHTTPLSSLHHSECTQAGGAPGGGGGGGAGGGACFKCGEMGHKSYDCPQGGGGGRGGGGGQRY
jgi:hypothetical protein